VLYLNRDHHFGVARSGGSRDRDRVDGLAPAGYHLCRRPPQDDGRGNSRDALGSRVPETDNVRPVEEEDGVGDICEDAGGVGTLLDLEVETSAIDRDADPRCQILGERELVRTVLRPLRAACERRAPSGRPRLASGTQISETTSSGSPGSARSSSRES
jgi:hypothetical protein